MGWQGPRAEWLWALPSIGLQSILYKLVDTPLDRGTIVKANSTIYVCDIKYFSKNDSNGYVYIIASITHRPGQDVVTRGRTRLIHCGRCLHGISGSLTSQDTDWMDQSYRVNRRGCWEERREYQHRSGPQEFWAPNRHGPYQSFSLLYSQHQGHWRIKRKKHLCKEEKFCFIFNDAIKKISNNTAIALQVVEYTEELWAKGHLQLWGPRWPQGLRPYTSWSLHTGPTLLLAHK